MTKTIEYLNFIKEKGRPVSEINPGSKEFALAVNDALQILDLLYESQTAILGGDILTEDDNNKLIYAYQLWGAEYHYLSWYCDRDPNESEAEYIKRSYEAAKAGIISANEVAERLRRKCLITLVIGVSIV